MRVSRQTRVRLRGQSEVTVRVRCDRCRRVLGELYGDREWPYSFSNHRVDGVLHATARVDYFRCQPGCGAAPEVRHDKLAAAYRKAASRPAGRTRVIWLPADIRAGRGQERTEVSYR